MTSIYHGGAKLEGEIETPLFLYENVSDSIYYATGYSGEPENYVTELTINDKAKVLDLVSGDREANERFLSEIIKKAGLELEDDGLVKNSYEAVGEEVYGFDIGVALYPKVKEALLKTGFNVLKTYTYFENSQPVGFAVLDSSALNLKREYEVVSGDDNVVVTVVKENVQEGEESTLGKSYLGMTGYGDIQLQEVVKSSKKKKM